jgi:hypothetical protein
MKGLDPMVSPDTGSFDDLLNDTPSIAEKAALSSLKDGGAPSESPEMARIRALEEQLAAAEKKVSLAEKSAEEKAQEHRKAVAVTGSFNNAPDRYEAVNEDDDYIVFHILESGFTFADRVWWVGQTIKIKKDGKAYQETLDRNGDTWLADISPEAQMARWNKIVLGQGPWTGPEFNDEVSKQDAKRGDAAPLIAFN